MHTPANYQIEQRDPRELRLHKALRHQPGEWADNDPRFERFCDDIAAHGIQEPLKVTKQNEILDGRHRWRGAKRHQLATIPVIVVDDLEAASYISRALTQRRHFTKGQIAYVLAPTLEAAWAEAQDRMLAGVKSDSNPRNGVSGAPATPEEWATAINVSVQYLRQARRIHEHFADDKKRKLNGEAGSKQIQATLREYFEPKILDAEDPHGLGAVLAGISSVLDAERKGKPHKGGKPAETERQLLLFNKVLDDELNRWDYWQKFDDETKAAHFKAVRAKAAQIDDADQLEAIADYHAKLAAEFRKAAKEASAAKGEK